MRTSKEEERPAEGTAAGGLPESQMRCLRACAAILEYADNTEAQLRDKLERRGFGRAEIDGAIGYYKGRGFFSERRYAFQFAYDAAVRRQWGPRRILCAMREKGFSRENQEAVQECLLAAVRGEGSEENIEQTDIENLLSCLDFPEICAILIVKNLKTAGYAPLRAWYREQLPEDREERAKLFRLRQKLYAALARRGFDFSILRDAEERVREMLARECGAEDGASGDRPRPGTRL